MKGVAKHIPVLSFMLSAVVAWLLMPLSDGFPLVPFALFFAGLSSLVYITRKDRTWFDLVLYVGVLLLSAFLIIRANEVLLFIDLIFITGFGSLLILPIAREHNLISLLLTPLAAIHTALIGENHFPYSWKFLRKYNRTDAIPKYLPSVLVTLLFLGVTIPLLASANPFFNQLVGNTVKFLDLTGLVRFFSGDEVFYIGVRIVLLGLFMYTIPRALTAGNERVARKAFSISLPVNYLIPKVAMAILLIIFFITQAQLYFASPDVLRSMGYTNSRLTNEVFFQVTLVAGVIFFLAYLDKKRDKWHQLLTYILILEAFFLVGIAFKSVIDYSSLWGLTQKRLWGYGTMTWLTGALLLFTYHYVKKIPDYRFFRLIVVYTILVLIGINIANFDYLIAHSSTARTESGTDYVYLARRSPDAHYYKETLKNLMRQIETGSTLEQEKVNAAYAVLRRIDFLQRKYGVEKPLNSFNFSEYQEYRNVRDINTENYRKKLTAVEQKYNDHDKVKSPQLPE